MMIGVEPEINPLSRGSDIASIVSAIVAVVSLMVRLLPVSQAYDSR
jgi:hypothetical protein